MSVSPRPSVVAVAGGTGGVGKTIVQQLQLHRDRYKVIVFTRNVQDRKDVSLDADNGTAAITEYVQVDYSTGNIEGMAALLRARRVKTVISAITINERTCDAQLNLIRAAVVASDVTKRFIPSEFGYVNVEEILALDPAVQHWISAAKLLASSPLQYTRIANGFFIDYLGMPHAETNMEPFTWVMDISGGRAAIPGTGEQVMSWTHSVDVARYVVKLLDVAEQGGRWDEWSILVGEDISFNEILTIARRVRGGTKGFQFHVTYDTLEELEKGNATVLPLPGKAEVDSSHVDGWVKETCALFGRLYLHGVLHMPRENRLTDRWRDEIRPLTVEEFLEQVWDGEGTSLKS